VTYASADAILDRVCRECWPARRPRSVSQWAEQERFVSGRTSARSGRWSNARTPYLVGIQDALCDPVVRQITVLKAPQVGFTECLINMLGWIAEHDPVMTMVVLPNEKLARAMAKKRVLPAVLASPTLGRRLGRSKEDRSSAVLSFDRCDIRFAAAGSDTNVRSWPAGVFIVDEYDLCPEGIEEEAEQRTRTYGERAKRVFGGTSSMDDMGIAKRFSLSDQHRFHVPCPFCGRYQTLDWERIRWDGGASARPDDAKATARYECVGCRQRIAEHHKLPMLQRGIWAPGTNQIVVQDGVPVVVGEDRPTSHRGFFIGGEMSPFVSWGDIASGFVAERGSPGRKWWNGIGRPWKGPRRKIDVEDVRKLAVKVADGGHERGWVPDDAIFLTGTVDTQLDHLWVQIDAWGANLDRSWLVDYFRLSSAPDTGMPELGRLLDRGWPIYNRDKVRGVTIRPWMWLIDSGDGNRTSEVYRFVKQHHAAPRRFVRAVKGFGGSGTPQEFKVARLDKWPDGTPMPGGVELLELNSRIWKDQVMTQLGLITTETDASMTESVGDVTPVVASRRVLPEDVPDDYLYQVTAEELVEKQRDGRKHWVWQMKQNRHHNHALDTTYYAVAATRVYGLMGVGEDAKARLRAMCQVDGPKPKPPERVPPRPAPPPPKAGREFGTDAPIPRMSDEWRG